MPTTRVQDDKGHRSLRAAALCLGFSVMLSLTVLVTWGGLHWQVYLGTTLPDLLLIKSVPQTLAIALTLMTSTALSPTLRAARVINALLTGLFILILTLPLLFPGSIPRWLIPIFSIILGIDVGGLFSLWGRLVSSCEDPSPLRISLVSLVLQAIILEGVSLLPPTAQSVSAIIMVLALAICFLLSTSGKEGAYPEVKSVLGPIQALSQFRSIARTVKPQLSCVAAVVFSFGFIRTTALMGAVDHEIVNHLGDAILLTVSLFLIALTSRSRYRGRDDYQVDVIHIYQLLFPALATLAVALPLFDDTVFLGAAALLHALFFIILAFIVAIRFDQAGTQGTSRDAMFGAFAGTSYLAVCVSTLLAYFVYREHVVDFATVAVCALAVVYSLSLGYAAVQRTQPGKTACPVPPSVPAPADIANVPIVTVEDLGARVKRLVRTYDLTGREENVLVLIARGYSVRGMADYLAVSQNTVRTHSKNLYRKLGVHSRQELLELLARTEPAQGI